MDTIEQTIEPVEGEGATSPADTSTNDTQTAESIDSVSDGNVEDAGEASTLLAGKYKSPEELEKAYQELQGKLGESSQKAEIANLLEKSTGMNAQQIKDYLAQQQYAQQVAQYQDNPVPYLANEVQTLKQQIALQKEEQGLDKFLSSEEGKPYQNFKDKIFKAKQLEPGKDYGDIAREWFGTARAQGQQDAYKKIDTKVMTQTTSASQAAPKGRITEEDMEKMSAAELEAILPHADTSNRLY